MYNPPLFKEDDIPVLHELIRRHGFATLVTLGPDGLTADHLPVELDPGGGPLGTLRGHVARANPVWRTAGGDAGALAIFQGPSGYVTPSWYATKRETGKVATNAGPLSGVMTHRPSGLFWSDASLATNLQ